MSECNSTVEYHNIQGFPGYRVGDDGSIWSCRKLVHHKGAGNRFKTSVILGSVWSKLVPWPQKSGYLLVSLRKENRKKNHLVHRLVLESFAGPCPEGMECRHFPDRTKSNNRLENLQWGTHEQNYNDRILHGTNTTGERNAMAKLTNASVLAIFSLKGTGRIATKTAREFGVTRQTVTFIWNGDRWGWLTGTRNLEEPTMKTETYSCNLCGQKRDKNDLRTMIYHSSKWIIVEYGSLLWPDADRHICNECVKLIKESCK